MSLSIQRSTRSRNLFVIVNGSKESVCEFPFRDGFKAMSALKGGEEFDFTDRVITKSAKSQAWQNARQTKADGPLDQHGECNDRDTQDRLDNPIEGYPA